MALPPLYACEFCGKEVDPAKPGTGQYVMAWVENKKGATTLHRRSKPHGFACEICMQDMKWGALPDQNALF